MKTTLVDRSALVTQFLNAQEGKTATLQEIKDAVQRKGIDRGQLRTILKYLKDHGSVTHSTTVVHGTTVHHYTAV